MGTLTIGGIGSALIAASALASMRDMRAIEHTSNEPRHTPTTHVDDPADVPSRQVRRKLERQARKRGT